MNDRLPIGVAIVVNAAICALLWWVIIYAICLL
jgi:hypothetical protein